MTDIRCRLLRLYRQQTSQDFTEGMELINYNIILIVLSQGNAVACSASDSYFSIEFWLTAVVFCNTCRDIDNAGKRTYWIYLSSAKVTPVARSASDNHGRLPMNQDNAVTTTLQSTPSVNTFSRTGHRVTWCVATLLQYFGVRSTAQTDLLLLLLVTYTLELKMNLFQDLLLLKAT